MNTARGYLVEYLVATVLGDESPIRVEWGSHDVEAADGSLVEIKSAGYLQSWATKKTSTPSWTFASVTADKVWSDDLGTYVAVDPRARLHVWVFALQTCQDPQAYDPMSIDQWELRVVPHRQLLATGQHSARLSFFDKLGASPVSYTEIATAVRSARAANDRLENPI